MAYANEYGYTDVHPYEIIRHVSDKMIEVRRMNATLSPDWKPNFEVGGFVGHVTNNSEQKWIYESDPLAPVVRIRLTKKGWKRSKSSSTFRLSTTPRKFRDYNF